MATITAAEVNKLRKMTGAGLMDCKKALIESNGDFDGAIDYLRKKGQKIAAKRADRDATEGVVLAKTVSEGNRGVVLYLTCETDFVAKNDEFVSFATKLTDLALNHNIQNKEDILSIDFDGATVKDRLDEQVGKIGEKIEIAELETIEADAVVPYIHANKKVGVLVGLNKTNTDAIEAAGKDVAMQIAAMRPVSVSEADVDPAILDKEREIGREKALAEGKPENIVDKIVEGSVKKFLKENTLLSQKFVKDGNQTIDQYLKSIEGDLTVTAFKRVAI